MTRILFTGSRFHGDPDTIGRALDAEADGHDAVTLIHGRCDPRTANAVHIARTGSDRVPWDTALAHPEYGPYLGADWHAHHHAVLRGWAVEEHPANWAAFGNAAGGVRNQSMVARGADIVVAAPLGPSPGTRDCMRRARQAGIPVVDITVPPAPEGLW